MLSQESLNAAIEFLESCRTRERRELGERKESLDSEISDLLRQLQNKRLELSVVENRLADYRSGKISKSRVNPAEQEALRNLNKIEKLTKKDGVLSIFTVPIICTEIANGESVLLGKYEVTITFRSETVWEIAIYGLNRDTPGLWPHPHVMSPTDPCWNTYENPINERIAKQDLIGLINLLFDFLEHSAHPLDAWRETQFGM